jgi:hypothetical protein
MENSEEFGNGGSASALSPKRDDFRECVLFRPWPSIAEAAREKVVDIDRFSELVAGAELDRGLWGALTAVLGQEGSDGVTTFHLSGRMFDI